MIAVPIGVPIAVLAALLAFSCGRSVPPVPTVSTQGLDADVQSAPFGQPAPMAPSPSRRAARACGPSRGWFFEAHHALSTSRCSPISAPLALEPERNSRGIIIWRFRLRQAAQLETALAAITDALRIRPDYVPAALKRGELLYKLGRFKESDAALTPLLAQNPNSATILYQLGRVKFSQQDFAAAEDLYRRACQAYPTYGAAWYALAETEKRLGHNADTAKNFELAESYKDHTPPTNDLLLNKVTLEAGHRHRKTD